MKALITGASAGIGREIAKILSKKGYETVLVGRNGDALSALLKELPAKSFAECTDLTDRAAVRALYEKHPDADLLVNCAGVGVFGEFDLTDLDREIEMIDLNITALHILTKLYYREFVKRGSGSILNIASSAAYFIGPAYSSYYASKAYVKRLTDALWVESKKRKEGVTVTLFCPGPVKTDFGKRDGIADGAGAVTPQLAVRRAVDAVLCGKRVAFPNFSTRALVLLSKLLPECLMAKFVYKQQLKKANNITLPLVKK